MTKKPVTAMTNAELYSEWVDIGRDVVSVGEELLANMRALQRLRAQLNNKNCGTPIEIKKMPDSAGAVISGYASVFNVTDQGNDIVLPGAFAASLQRHDRAGTMPLMLWQHDRTEPIGVWEDMLEDSRGLKVRGRLLTTVQRGREAAELIRADALAGLSIGYKVIRDELDSNTGIRKLIEVELYEISIVSFPMARDARITDKGKGPVDQLLQAAESLSRACRSYAQ